VVLISDGTSIKASNGAAQLGLEDTKGAYGTYEDAEGQLTENRAAEIESKPESEKEQNTNNKQKPMGRYKSVLMAEKDARDFPHHVELPIPPFGLGKRLDIIAAWLNTNIGPDWRSHSHLERGEDTALYMFRRHDEAVRFSEALNGEFE
jgi:hypothetical protein